MPGLPVPRLQYGYAMMNAVLAKISGIVMAGLVRLSGWTLRIIDLAAVQLGRLWKWYNGLRLPQIPLSAVQWLMLCYVLLAVLFVWSTPVFEAGDEIWHFGMAETIAATGELPVQAANTVTMPIYGRMGTQPPLYYGLAALLLTSFDLSDVDQYRMPNPHAAVGVPDWWGNKNLVLHELADDVSAAPALAVYALRLVNVALGAVTVWVVVQIGALIAPQRPIAALIAGVLTALNPMFLFIHASVNNHALAILLNSVVIWLSLLTLRNGFDLRRSVAIGVVLALAVLTRLSALALIPAIVLGVVWMARRDQQWRGLLVLLGAMIAGCLLIAGWWYVRNVTLYGDIIGLQIMAQTAGIRPNPADVVTYLREFEWFRNSYWGLFGVSNLQTSAVFYTLADLLTLTALAGVLFLIAQLAAIRDFGFARHELRLLLFLAGIVLTGMLTYFIWNMRTFAADGYLLFAFIGAISPLLGAGLAEVMWWVLFMMSPPERSYLRPGDGVPQPIQQSVARWGAISAGLLVLLIPFGTIVPQYSAPAAISEADIPLHAARVYARYDDVELLAYEAIDRRYAPGEPVRVTLYWRVLQPSAADLNLSLELVDPYGNMLASLDTYPGAGNLRTSRWQAGAIYADRYQIALPQLLSMRMPFYLKVDWYEQTRYDPLRIVDDRGTDLSQVRLNIGAVIARDHVPNADAINLIEDVDPALLNFGNLVQLRGFGFDQELSLIQVYWESLSQIEQSYKSFVHVYNQDGELVTQDDIYPELPTRYWVFGEDFILSYLLPVPADGWQSGTYSVEVGWYDELDPLARLQVGYADDLRSTYQMFSFEVGQDGRLILPVFEQAEATESAPEGPEMPDMTPTGAGA